MGDMKSKIPDFKELASMTSKLFGDIKTSVGQIIQDYKEIRAKAEMKEKNSEDVKKEPASKADEELKSEEKTKETKE